MGTQKGRVDVQQQLPSFLRPSHPPSLQQTPQLPGAAPARPEVTRLLPTTRLRLALPLSISLLPPSFVRPLRSPCFSQSSLFSSCSSSPATNSRIPPPLSFTCVHTRGLLRVSLSFRLSFAPAFFLARSPSVVAADSARGNTSGSRFAAASAEVMRAATLFRVVESPRRNATSRRPTSTLTTVSRHAPFGEMRAIC